MNQLYYKVAHIDTIHKYVDIHHWDINNEYECEALFIDLAADHYQKMPDRWNQRGFDVVVLCTETGKPICAMEVTMELKPQFEAYVYNKNDL